MLPPLRLLLGTFLAIAALSASAQTAQAPVISTIPDQALAPGVVSAPITFSVTDADTAVTALKVSASAADPTVIPSTGISITLGRTGIFSLRLTPARVGKTAVTIVATDGRLEGTRSFGVIVEAANTPPTISDVPDQVIPTGGASGPLSFTIGDAQTDPARLSVTVQADNQDLLGKDRLILGGAGAARTLTIIPAPNLSGSGRVTLTVSDGVASVSDTLAVTVLALDFGDAPDKGYQTLLASGGAVQRIIKGFNLGADIDGDRDGQPDATATGDGADEDGVKFADALNPGQSARVVIAFLSATGGTGRIDGWIDFDGDGKWEPNLEHVVDGGLSPGDNVFTIQVPAGAKVGPTFARFRLSQEGAVGPTGFSTEAGEVEDYQVEIRQGVIFDFGDAPDPTYPTTLKNNGARHVRNPDIFLGRGIDAEADGQPNASATGDDQIPSTADDEDGVQFAEPLTIGGTASVSVRASTQGSLWAWIDFNADGDWLDAGEQAITGASLVSGVNTLTFIVPPDAKEGSTFSRFRFTRGKVDGFTGEAPDGEVEDLTVRIGPAQPTLDFGDAPNSYQTLAANDGARHTVLKGFNLGKQIDVEADGQPNASAVGDDQNPTAADDEDGVTFTGGIVAGQSTSVLVEATAAGRLDAWIDFNADGDFADAGERIFTTFTLVAGANTLGFVTPATATAGSTFARFRLSREGVKDFFGAAPDGEVEDYVVRISAPEAKLDFGDAPEPTFPTTLKNNGARHRINADVFLGQRIDAESDGQPSASASGDDASPAGVPSDEDGVAITMPLVPGQTGQVTVQTSTQGLLSAWIDFNQDGDWLDAGEEIFGNQAVVGGANALTFAVPTDSKAGSSVTRFRFSRTKIPGFLGEAEDGEVEDGTVRVSTPQATLDFGDAPDPTYPTTLKNNGARHRINPDVFLGIRVDAEADGQPNAGSSGDDTSPAGTFDDEDGVNLKLPLVAGQNGEVEVTASTQGRLWAWVDFNADGDWADVGERIFNGQVLVNGLNNLTFPVPSDAKVGPSFSRFRFTRTTIESYVGEASDGEVEDHPVRISAPESRFDYGDAPEEGTSFPTTIARKGAYHQVEPGFRLGHEEDIEPDGQPDAASSGDDNVPAGGPDDEDGVRFLTPIVPGATARVEIVSTADGRVDAWIDFNLNRSWNDAGEKILNGQPVVAGINVFSFVVPTASQRGGISYSRFRLSRQGGLNTDGFGGIGEVEDHLVRIDRGQPCELGCTGVDFWLTFPGNYAPDPANPVRPQLCILGGAGTQVTIRIAALGYNNVVNIPAAGSVNVLLPAGADLGDANDLIESKGVHVTATGPVTVHALNQVKYTSDGYTALSAEVLGTEYLVLGYGNLYTAVPELNGTQFALVATEDQTKVTIIPSEVTGTHDSGFAYSIELNAGQTYQLRNTNDAPRDLTGTRILADKPVAVFSGHQIANVQSKEIFYADHLVEQLLPLNRWGTEFFARPFAIPTPPGARASYSVRVLASQANTRVFINGVLTGTLGKAEHLDRVLTGAAAITTDRPALMAQFAHSSDSDGVVNSDPFMVLGQQRNLFNRDVRFCTAPAGFLTHHINVIAPTAALGTVQLDGAAFPGAFALIPGTGYSHATVQVGAGIHRVTCSQPLGVIVYGWNEYESYAWPACQFFGDTTPPDLTCPTEEIKVEAGNVGDVAVFRCSALVPDLRGQVKATDNCGFGSSAVGVQVQQDPAPGTRVGVGTHEIVLSVTDAQGNVGRCFVKFIVTDPNPDGELSLICPRDMTVACTATNGAIVQYQVFALRGCTPVSVRCDPAPGSFFPLGETTVTCFLDDEENPQTCTFKVTVQCRRTITIGVVDRTPVLDWGAGSVLESSEQIQGPWTTVEGARPPFNVVPQGSRKFFRIRD